MNSGRKGIRMSKTKTIAVFGVGPGMGRAVARRFGREGFQVALVARNQTRLEAFTAGAAARHYLHTLHTDLADTGVYAGVLQISGPVGDSDAGNYVIETYGAANLPEPQKPADLADAMWDLYLKRDRFDQVFGA